MRALVLSLLRVAMVVAGQSDHPRVLYVYSLLGERVSWRSLHGQHKGRWRVAVAMVVVVVVAEKPALVPQLGRAACSHPSHTLEHTGRPAEVCNCAGETVMVGRL